MSNKIEKLPDQVKDREQYDIYVKLSKMKAITLPDRLIPTSDLHITIDPFTTQSVIDRDIKDLPLLEKEQIMKKVKIARTLQNQMLIARNKAYGTNIHQGNHNALSSDQMNMILDERTSEILEYYGRYLSDEDILKIIHLEWGYNVTLGTLKNFKKANKKKIAQLQESFRKDLNSSKLYHKRFRLEELGYLYNERKIAYESSKSREDVKLMTAIIKQAKDEVEAHEIHIKGEFTHKIESAIGEHIEREIMAGLTITDIIIARVSHRLGVNPAYLINRLRTSVYAKFTGFGESQDSLLEEEIVYPSTMVYNWQEIERANHLKEKKGKEFIEFEEIKEDEVKTLDSIREQLKKRIETKSQKISTIRDRIEKNIE